MPMPPFPAFLSREALAAWQASIGPDTAGRVSKQHLVSAVILRRFHDPAQHKLEYLSVEWPDRKQKLIGARGAGAVTDFLTYATASAEEQWKGIEDRIPAALAAVEGGNTPQSDEHQATIIGIMALHMARNPRFTAMHANAWQELVARERQRFLSEPDRLDALRREFYQRHGLHAAGVGPLGELYDAAIQEVVDGQMPERLARLQVEIKFYQLLFWLPRATFHLLRPEAGEFVIGDSPTVLLDYNRERFGGVWDIGLDNATHIVMPLGPRLSLTAALDGGSRFLAGTADQQSVQHINVLQARTALRHVFYRPGEKRREFVRGALRQKSAAAGPVQ